MLIGLLAIFVILLLWFCAWSDRPRKEREAAERKAQRLEDAHIAAQDREWERERLANAPSEFLKDLWVEGYAAKVAVCKQVGIEVSSAGYLPSDCDVNLLRSKFGLTQYAAEQQAEQFHDFRRGAYDHFK